MGILDEAIREHLELKRAHGADDSELKQLEDQAFGPPERPGADPAAEAPTEFMAQPDLGEENAAAVQDGATAVEEPPSERSEQPPSEEQAAAGRREPAAGLADIQEPPAKVENEEPDADSKDDPAAEVPDDDGPASEEQPAAEREAIPAPEEGSPGSHTTAERHAIADQPTEMFDVEEEFAATDAPAPADEDLVAEEIGEARLVPADPITPPPAPLDDEDDDDFFSEQRLSDELDQALEAPSDPEPEPISDEHEALREPTDEHEVVHTDEHEAVAEHTDEHEVAEEERTQVHPVQSRDSEEDVLEETPDFLEETPEDDQLWFEQKPPKDFDFDD